MALKEGLSYFLTKVVICILLRIGVNEKLYCYLTKSSSAAGRTRLWLGNTSTCTQRAFWHIARLSTAAGCPRRWLGNTSTCPQRAFWRLIMTLLDIKTHMWTSACIAKPMPNASCSWLWVWYFYLLCSSMRKTLELLPKKVSSN